MSTVSIFVICAIVQLTRLAKPSPQNSIAPLPSENPPLQSGVNEEPKTTLDKVGDPWKLCNDYAKKNTQDLCESWKDQVGNLLIFVGLMGRVTYHQNLTSLLRLRRVCSLAL